MYSHRLPAGHKASSLAALWILVNNVLSNTTTDDIFYMLRAHGCG